VRYSQLLNVCMGVVNRGFCRIAPAAADKQTRSKKRGILSSMIPQMTFTPWYSNLREALKDFMISDKNMQDNNEDFKDSFLLKEKSSFRVLDDLFEGMLDEDNEHNTGYVDVVNKYYQAGYMKWPGLPDKEDLQKLFLRFLEFLDYHDNLIPQFKFLVQDPAMYNNGQLALALEVYWDSEVGSDEKQEFCLLGNPFLDFWRSLGYLLHGRVDGSDPHGYLECKSPGFWRYVRSRYSLEGAPDWQCEFLLRQELTPDSQLCRDDFPQYSEWRKLKYSLGNRKVFLMNRYAVTLATLSLILNTYLEQDGFNLLLVNLAVSTVAFAVFGYGLWVDKWIYSYRLKRVLEAQGLCSIKCKKMLPHLVWGAGGGRAVYLSVSSKGGQMHMEYTFTPPLHYIEVFEYRPHNQRGTKFNRGEIYSSYGYLHYYHMAKYFLVESGFDTGSGTPLLNGSIEVCEVPYYHTYLSLPVVQESIIVNAVGLAFNVDCAFISKRLVIFSEVSTSLRHCIEAVVSRKCKTIKFPMCNQVMSRSFKKGTEKFDEAWGIAKVIAEKKDYLKKGIESPCIKLSNAWRMKKEEPRSFGTRKPDPEQKGEISVLLKATPTEVYSKEIESESEAMLNTKCRAYATAVRRSKAAPTYRHNRPKVRTHFQYDALAKQLVSGENNMQLKEYIHRDYTVHSSTPSFYLDDLEKQDAACYSELVRSQRAFFTEKKISAAKLKKEMMTNLKEQYNRNLKGAADLCKGNPYAVRLLFEVDMYSRGIKANSILDRNSVLSMTYQLSTGHPVYRNSVSRLIRRQELGYFCAIIKHCLL